MEGGGRRRFIKTIATLPLLPYLTIPPSTAGQRESPESSFPDIQWIPSTCIICGQGCPIKLGVVSTPFGRRIYQETFNVDPRDPRYYASCARPRALDELIHHPDRIRRPMVRSGERGEGRFEEISWEEAIEILAGEIRKRLDSPWEILVFAHQGLDKHVLTEFFKLVGTPNITKHSDTCHTASDVGRWYVFGKLLGPGSIYPDYEHARFVVLMGRNPYGGFVSTPWAKSFQMGLVNGMRVAVYDVRYTEVCSYAERYFLIRPGTDLAVSLAILNTLLGRGWVDREYLVKYTNAAMLVDLDNLLPVTVEGGYAVYDLEKNEFVVHGKAVRPALEFTGLMDGVEVATVYSLLKSVVEPYTPEWAEEVSGVSSEDIYWTAENLYRWAPRSFIDHGYKTVRYLNESMWHRVNALINVVIGSVGRVGGWLWPRKAKPPLPTKYPSSRHPSIPSYWRENGYPFVNKKAFSMLAVKTLLTGKPYKVSMVVVYLENLVAHIPGSYTVAEALMKTEFNVQFNTMWDETSPYMDLVLPIPFFFEVDASSVKAASKGHIGQVSIAAKASDPPEYVDVRPTPWIIYQLVRRLFPRESYKFKRYLRPRMVWEWQARKMGIDYSHLLSHGVYTMYREPIINPLHKGRLPTKTGLIELINFEALERFRDYLGEEHNLNPLPTWIRPRWMVRGLDRDEFVAIDYMSSLMAINTWARNTPLLLEMLKWLGEDLVWINVERGEELGIGHGDLVRIAGEGGEAVVRVGLTSRISREVMAGVHGLNPGSHVKGDVSMRFIPASGMNTNLVSPLYIVDGIGSAALHDVVVKVVEVVG